MGNAQSRESSFSEGSGLDHIDSSPVYFAQAPLDPKNPFLDTDAPHSSQARVIRAQNRHISYLESLLASELEQTTNHLRRISELEEENARLTDIAEHSEPLVREAQEQRDHQITRVQQIEAEQTEALESLRVEAEERFLAYRTEWQQEALAERRQYQEALRQQEQEAAEVINDLREALSNLQDELDARSSTEYRGSSSSSTSQ